MDVKATWTAKNTPPASASGDNATPTEVAAEDTPTAESSVSDPTDVLSSFFQSVDNKQIDDAMDLVSDDVVFNVGSTSGVGKDQLKAYLQGQVDKGVVYKSSDITTISDIIHLKVQANLATGDTYATYANSTVILDGGEISVLTLQ